MRYSVGVLENIYISIILYMLHTNKQLIKKPDLARIPQIIKEVIEQKEKESHIYIM